MRDSLESILHRIIHNQNRLESRLEELYVRDSLLLGLSARVYRSTTQSIGISTWTDISFSHERWDTGITDDFPNGFWHASPFPQRIMIPVRGLYLAVGNVGFQSTDRGTVRRLGIKVNTEANHIGRSGYLIPTTQSPYLQVQTLWPCEKNNWLTLQVFHDASVPIDVVAEANYSPEFWILKVR